MKSATIFVVILFGILSTILAAPAPNLYYGTPLAYTYASPYSALYSPYTVAAPYYSYPYAYSAYPYAVI
ncbi:hypothetical protein CBL_12771 [Carabus blaptoides fortunei]